MQVPVTIVTDPSAGSPTETLLGLGLGLGSEKYEGNFFSDKQIV